MNSQSLVCRTHLEHAEALLREVVLCNFENASGDAKSLDGIRVHIQNIQQAISASDEVHVNAAKRLGDFAVTTSRILARNPGCTPQLTEICKTLRAAESGIQSLVIAAKTGAEPAATTA